MTVDVGKVVGDEIAVTCRTTGAIVGAEGAQAERIKKIVIVSSLFITVLRNLIVNRPYILP
jgi:hypothetical protein